jgi:predicted  nucleic acid-binding Zn-ribbon protein
MSVRSRNWMLEHPRRTANELLAWERTVQTYIDSVSHGAKLRFVMYDGNVHGSQRVYIVFTDKVTTSALTAYFPMATGHTVLEGHMCKCAEYYRDRALFKKLGIEPRQQQNKRMRDSADDEGIDLATQLVASQQETDSLKAQFSDLKAQFSDLKAQCSDLKAECSGLRQQLKTQVLEASSVLEASELKKQETDSLKAQCSDLRQQLKTQVLEASELKKQETYSLKAQCSDLRQQLDSLKAQCSDLQRSQEASELKYGDLDERFKSLHQQSIYMGKSAFEQLRCAFQLRISTTYREMSLTLETIYIILPPLRLEAKLVLTRGDNASIAKALKTAKFHYHPDKQGHGDSVRHVICTSILQLLNHMQEEFDKRGYEEWDSNIDWRSMIS